MTLGRPGPDDRTPVRAPARWFRRRNLVVALSLLLAGVAALTVVTHLPSAAQQAVAGPIVVASMPYFNLDHGTSAVLANRGDVNEASPWIYGLDAGGEIVDQYSPGQRAEVTGDIARLRGAGIRLVPTVANVVDGDFAYQPIAGILHDSARTDAHVAAIVDLVEREDFAGIDIDYEDLHAADRQAFTDYLTGLAGALHSRGKLLSVALFAKATDAGYDQRNVAQDYAAIGRVADQVRLMGYDYHWSTSPPGAIAPIGWINSVLAYARTQIPPDKIVLGIPMYGYDWVGNQGASVTWQQAVRLAQRHHVPITYDKATQSPWFRYTDSAGTVHEVWFENAASVAAKLSAARAAGAGGVFLWLYGPEDTGMWPALHQAYPLPRAARDTGRP
ncbi:MAG TPA: glycosyl hydrolase family 18 protein [Pseudonocardiaceae bacterium]|nr:glycosyl hydrolase family 18 protein [Pseudonocardiaceae bacterium]